MTTSGFHARAKRMAGPVLAALAAACLPIALCPACMAAQARAAGPDARVWVPAMKKVHARFKGQRGTLALFGDSITVSRAFWFGLQHTRKNADAEMVKAFERVKSYMLEDCWDRRGPEYGNEGRMTIRWAHENVDAWLKRLNPEVALIMFGTNDLGGVKLEEYEAKTRQVVEKCLAGGTIVILSTIPPKHGQAQKAAVFAEAVRKIARDLEVPLTDYHAEILKRRPDDWDGAMEKFSGYQGYDVPTLISRDGVHPSNPPKYANDYSAEGLRHNGYALRSYLALMKYAEVIEKVLPRKPDAPIVPHKAIRLFNGRDLNGWTTWLVDTKRRDPRGVYSVRDGMIRISGDGFGYLSTDRAYQDYRLVVEVKWGAQNFRTRKGMARDSGIFLHSAGPEGGSYDCGWGSRRSNTGREISSGAYKAAIECQVMEGGFGDLLLIHGRYADGRHVPVRVTVPVAERRVAADYAKYQYDPKAARQMLHSGAIAWIDKDPAWKDVPGFRGRSDVESPHGKWTRVECVCAGDRITVLVNGKRVNEASEVFPTAGKILLQCEGSGVFFRKIELHPLGKASE